jgi:hypothetical protein
MEITNDELALKLEQLAIDVKKDKFGDREHFDSFGFIQEIQKIIQPAITNWVINYDYKTDTLDFEIPPMPDVKPLKSSVSDQNCGNCRFWRPVQECRKNAPHVVAITGMDPNFGAILKKITVFPTMGGNCWCGQWEASEEYRAELRESIRPPLEILPNLTPPEFDKY